MIDFLYTDWVHNPEELWVRKKAAISEENLDP